MISKKEFILELERIGAIKFGSFILKSGLTSPFYIDLRELISYPKLMDQVCELIADKVKNLKFDIITGIPYTALPLATLVSTKLNKPLVYIRKEEKAYGTGKNVVGSYAEDSRCLVIDDLVTTGLSKIETAHKYQSEGIEIKDFFVIIDRSQNAVSELAEQGFKLHSIITLDEILSVLSQAGKITKDQVHKVREFTTSIVKKEEPVSENEMTAKLCDLIEKKESNLVLSLDVDEQEMFFEILDQVAEEIVMLKTHVDIIKDYDRFFLDKLVEYSQKYEFMIFEDRKFADIGSTVRKQYNSGIYHISKWAEFVTVHSLPGEGILQGLFESVEKRSSFLLARMSSKGNLITDYYTRKTIEMGRKYDTVVSGFIGHGESVDDIKRFRSLIPENMLLLMPGVKLEKGSDTIGQQYITVEDAIGGGADCIIVGRGIYENPHPKQIAKTYRKKAWAIYKNNRRR
jgi:uridine monophosphate synthetase